MIRFHSFSLILLAACSPVDAPDEPPIAGNFAGEGRDRLCIASKRGDAGYRAGFITYGAGDSNCSVAGRLVRQTDSWLLIPEGEGGCRFPLRIAENSVTIEDPPPDCAYYCGPGASAAGRQFDRAGPDRTARDFAGDPLCPGT